eukprot:SAG25_NODE_3027_length_1262_cov_1.199484_1_plen_55_part_10
MCPAIGGGCQSCFQSQAKTTAKGAVGQQTVSVAGAAAGGVADVVGNPLTDVAEGI